MFIVGDRDTWKNQEHQFRKDKSLQIKSVPTLGYFDGKQLLNKLDGDEMLEKSNRDLVYENHK
jgi:hypothetical protein